MQWMYDSYGLSFPTTYIENKPVAEEDTSTNWMNMLMPLMLLMGLKQQGGELK